MGKTDLSHAHNVHFDACTHCARRAKEWIMRRPDRVGPRAPPNARPAPPTPRLNVARRVSIVRPHCIGHHNNGRLGRSDVVGVGGVGGERSSRHGRNSREVAKKRKTHALRFLQYPILARFMKFNWSVCTMVNWSEIVFV